ALPPVWNGARSPTAARRQQPRSARAGARKELQAAARSAERECVGAARRSRRAARAQWRRQDDLLLYHHRVDCGRYWRRNLGWARHHGSPDVSQGPARHWLSAVLNLDFTRSLRITDTTLHYCN